MAIRVSGFASVRGFILLLAGRMHEEVDHEVPTKPSSIDAG
jgi:hypothetical protein